MDYHHDSSSGRFLPSEIRRYIAVNVDTTAKATNHVLTVLAVSDFFLWIHAGSFSTFVAASFLVFQTYFVACVTNRHRFHYALPRSWEPTEFVVGVATGACAGGAVLSFYISMIVVGSFRIWWWSSMICGTNMLLVYLIVKGKEGITLAYQERYNSIDNTNSNSNGRDIDGSTNNNIDNQPPLQQVPSLQQQQNKQQQQLPNNEQQYGGYSYSDGPGPQIMAL